MTDDPLLLTVQRAPVVVGGIVLAIFGLAAVLTACNVKVTTPTVQDKVDEYVQEVKLKNGCTYYTYGTGIAPKYNPDGRTVECDGVSN